MTNMYVIVAYFVGLVNLAAGLVCLFKASKLKPNTYLGFRVPSAFLSQNIWTKVNIFSGIFGSINFVTIVVLSLFVQNIYLLTYSILSVMLMISAISIYARRIIERETGKESGGETLIEVLPIIKINMWVIYLGWIIICILMTFIVLSRNQLPEIIGVHFDAAGHPDLFMHRDEFLVSFLSLALGSITLFSTLLYSVKNMPSLKEFESYNRYMVIVLQFLSVCIPLLCGYVYLTVYYYNVYGERLPILIDIALALTIILILAFNATKYLQTNLSKKHIREYQEKIST